MVAESSDYTAAFLSSGFCAVLPPAVAAPCWIGCIAIKVLVETALH